MRNQKGFTLIELMLTVSIIGLIASVVLIGTQTVVAIRRDARRVTDIKSLQDGLAIYASKTQQYVPYVGCITGADPVTAGLHAQAVIPANADFKDPTFTADVTKCFYYTSTGSTYTLRYTLEKDSNAGDAGDHNVVP
jgi:prepilin-type N-terminal cleavage/methylation domain-containing protein